jgi:hypothetical protein
MAGSFRPGHRAPKTRVNALVRAGTSRLYGADADCARVRSGHSAPKTRVNALVRDRCRKTYCTEDCLLKSLPENLPRKVNRDPPMLGC